MILATAYLGNIQYYTKLLSGEAVIDLNENYQKQSYRNRCDILTANGISSLTVPVLKLSGERIMTRDVRIDNSKKWQHQHYQAIVSAYRGSPYFLYYEDEFAPCYRKRYDFLADLNNELQEIVLRLLGTDIRPRWSEAPIPVTGAEDDFRNSLSPKARLQRPDPDFRPQPYYQVFAERFDFAPNLSVLDLLCCEGPAAAGLLKKDGIESNAGRC